MFRINYACARENCRCGCDSLFSRLGRLSDLSAQSKSLRLVTERWRARVWFVPLDFSFSGYLSHIKHTAEVSAYALKLVAWAKTSYGLLLPFWSLSKMRFRSGVGYSWQKSEYRLGKQKSLGFQRSWKCLHLSDKVKAVCNQRAQPAASETTRLFCLVLCWCHGPHIHAFFWSFFPKMFSSFLMLRCSRFFRKSPNDTRGYEKLKRAVSISEVWVLKSKFRGNLKLVGTEIDKTFFICTAGAHCEHTFREMDRKQSSVSSLSSRRSKQKRITLRT